MISTLIFTVCIILFLAAGIALLVSACYFIFTTGDTFEKVVWGGFLILTTLLLVALMLRAVGL